MLCGFFCDHFHAGAVSFADAVAYGLEAAFTQQFVQTLAPEVVKVLEFPPIGIHPRAAQNRPEHAVHVRHGNEQDAVFIQEAVNGFEKLPGEGDMLKNVGHADDAVSFRLLQVFNVRAETFDVQRFERRHVIFAQVDADRRKAVFLRRKQERAV